MRPEVTRVKFCGMTRAEDIRDAVDLGVDAIGMVLYPESKRAVTLEQAARLAKEIPAFVDLVAVVVNPEPAFVVDILNHIPIQYLQFHGTESASFCESFSFPYIKAIEAKSEEYIRRMAVEYQRAKALLVDTATVDSFGGTGQVFDWSLLPTDVALPFIVAGGLTTANVQQAIAQCRPFAVDVSSGIESSAGIKNREKMRCFKNRLCMAGA
ncbi:MAG: phosphoribosylanthranilate isomerase [Legionellaceae bacterium]|nr:phosphoribosylanthranilate isomerase [Legionellaceae bacterium]